MARGLKQIVARTDLGLDVRWRYSFVPAGSAIEPLSDNAFIDVGVRLVPGVVDHHHEEASGRSTADLVTRHPGFVHEHLVGSWIMVNRASPLNGRIWNPVSCMPANPDCDAIATTVLVQSLVEQGELPHHWDTLVKYADGMEEVLRIERRRESTGDLLQLLDDEEQEVSEWRLNRLGLILAIMGVMQTIIAAFEAVEASWAADLPEGRSRFHAVWANATFGVTAVFALFALTMVVPFFQRLYGRAPILGRFFPEHARVPVKKRVPTWANNQRVN